jgi:hypothetical protein
MDMNIPNVNHTVINYVHAYKQAPWRIQRQWIGTFMLAVLGLAMVAALYLDVTSQAAISGREIQDLTSQMIANQHANADLQTRLAELTSMDSMETRAQNLGFISVDTGQMEYLVVPGYSEPIPEILAGVSALKPSAPSIPPEYTESLIDWIDQHLGNTSTTSLIGVSQ